MEVVWTRDRSANPTIAQTRIAGAVLACLLALTPGCDCGGDALMSTTRSCTTSEMCPSGTCVDRVCVPRSDAGRQPDTGAPIDTGTPTDTGTPMPEQCGNGTDDDGDGAIDEGCACIPGQSQACFSGTRPARGVGACADGSQDCATSGGEEFGHWGECADDVLPVAERCADGTDDDCDGAVDDGCPCADGESRDCGFEFVTPPCHGGRQRCVGGVWTGCEGAVAPAAEMCGNGADDDCNGVVDMDCVCTPIGEICGNGVDDDCNGVVDTDCVCTPIGEICGNGVDDDCDGEVDENVAPAPYIRIVPSELDYPREPFDMEWSCDGAPDCAITLRRVGSAIAADRRTVPSPMFPTLLGRVTTNAALWGPTLGLEPASTDAPIVLEATIEARGACGAGLATNVVTLLPRGLVTCKAHILLSVGGRTGCGHHEDFCMPCGSETSCTFAPSSGGLYGTCELAYAFAYASADTDLFMVDYPIQNPAAYGECLVAWGVHRLTSDATVFSGQFLVGTSTAMAPLDAGGGLVTDWPATVFDHYYVERPPQTSAPVPTTGSERAARVFWDSAETLRTTPACFAGCDTCSTGQDVLEWIYPGDLSAHFGSVYCQGLPRDPADSQFVIPIAIPELDLRPGSRNAAIVSEMVCRQADGTIDRSHTVVFWIDPSATSLPPVP